MALQNVLIAASRGNEITKPPPNLVASRTFRHRFFPGRPKIVGDLNTRKSLIEKEPLNVQGSDDRSPAASPRPSLKKSVQVSSPISVTASMTHHVSPQSYCTSLLKTRGYSTTSYRALETSYYNKPTEFQLLSYGLALIEAIKTGNANLLSKLLAVGLSPNACNAHGESIVHMVCRSGNKDCLQVLLDYGGSVQVADDYGRTPMHEACFSREPRFELVDLILEQDRRLFYIEDSKGALPLSYLHAEQWTAWTKYLMSRKDKFWPDRDVSKQGLEADPPRTLEAPNTRPFPNTKDALPVDLLRMVANKRIDHMEAALLKEDFDDSSSDADSITDDSSSSFDGGLDSEDEDEDEDESVACDDSDDSSAFDESELEHILGCITKGKAIAWSS